MSTSQEVRAAFKIESASIDVTSTPLAINYVKGSTPAELPLTLKNTSNDFLLKVYPSSSTDIMKVFQSATEINKDVPLLISTGSSVDVTVRLIGDLNNRPQRTTIENLEFNLMAAKYVTVAIPPETEEEDPTKVTISVNWSSVQNYSGLRRIKITSGENIQYIVINGVGTYIQVGQPLETYIDDSIAYSDVLTAKVPKNKLVTIEIFPEPTEEILSWQGFEATIPPNLLRTTFATFEAIQDISATVNLKRK
jgi:hypothetical protein